MTKHKLFKHVLPIILSAMLLFSVLPVSASANNESTDEVASKIVREVVELREESVKHFLCEDGSYIAVSYAEPVHYEKNGEWLEIDNTLVLSSENTYVPKSNDLAVSIPQSFSDGEQITATNNGHTISFGVASGNENVALSKTASTKAVEALPSSIAADVSVEILENAELSATATVGKVDTAAQIEAYNSEKTIVDNQAGALVYDRIFPNADLEYIVTGNSIKENIVVYQPQTEYVYTFDMDFGGLTPVAEEDGSYRLIDSAKPDETVFVLAAPYMYDANGEESYEVEMSLTQNGNNYLLTLTADKTWINSNERAFPVVIDPTVYYNYDDVFVINGLYANSPRVKEELRVGRNLTNLTRTYIKPTVPTIPVGSVIDTAYFTVWQDYYYQAPLQDDIYVRLYDCYYVDSWSPDSISWNNQPFDNSDNGYKNVANSSLGSLLAYVDRAFYQYDITETVKRWLETGDCEGLMLASSDETSKTQVDLHSSRSSTTDRTPKFYLSYELPHVNIDQLEFNSPDAATSSPIKITTSEAWSITVDQPWISVSQISGTGSSEFTISVTENTSVSQRTGYVTVWMGSVKIGEIKVERSGSGAYLFLDETPIFIDYKTYSKTVTVDTNDSSLEIVLELWNNTDNDFDVVDIEDNNDSIDAWIRVVESDDKIDLTVCKENTTDYTKKARITVTAQSDTNTVTKRIHITQYDKVTCLFNTINEDGTLSAISSTEYNHALATWAMELSYAAYNYPSGVELPGIPGDFMGDVNYTAAVLLGNHGFAASQIKEYNYDVKSKEDSNEYERDPTAAGAHTIAYRNIEFSINDNNTDEEQGVENNDSNLGIYQSDISESLYDCVCTVNTNTNALLYDLQLTEDEPVSDRPLVVVTVRGSVTLNDWINNAITQLYPMDNRFVALKDEVVQNLENDFSALTDPIILVTGHSLGAAIANLLAADLSAELGIANVYAYTFATPQVVTESLDQEAIPYPNIFNILNSNDVVTYMPTTLIVPLANFWTRHGIDIPLNMPYNEYIPTEPIGVFCHSMAVYMAWMNNNPNMTYESIMDESEEAKTRGILPWIVKIKCPVGVTVKDSEGNIIAYESQKEGITYPEITDTGIVSWIDDDGAKVFFMPHYADAATIEIDAYDYGTMTMSMGLLGAEETSETEGTDETTEALNSITYNNVNLFPGRAFDVDLTEITEEVSMDDISLMEVEVNADGTRTDIGEITDLNPLLKSVTVQNPVVNYGTSTVFTIVVDCSVTKVRFTSSDGYTYTTSIGSSYITNVIDNGNEKILTLERILQPGDNFYDVSVKADGVWYTTENVFRLIIN